MRSKLAAFGGLLWTAAAPAASVPLSFAEPYLVRPAPSAAMHVCRLTGGPTARSYVEYGGTERYGRIERAVTHEIEGLLRVDAARWFNMMQQTADGCRLLQYVPIFPAPGNHQIDDQTLLTDRRLFDRHRIDGVHYIEAASIGNTYRTAKDPPCPPKGPCPEFEWIPSRTLLFVSICPDTGVTAEGVPAGGYGKAGWASDSFQIAPPLQATPVP